MLHLSPKIRVKHLVQLGVSFVLGVIVFYLLKILVVHISLPDIEVLLLRVLMYGAVIEEVLKFSVAYFLIRKLGFSPLTASFIGLGFGMSEQFLHIEYGDKALIHTMLMHYVSGLASSFYFYKARTFEYKKCIWKALLAPIGVHGIFNIGIWIWLMTYIYLL